MSSIDLFTVSEELAGQRLDKLLALHFSGYSRSYFQSLIEQGCVLVNGKLCKKREALRLGDEIEVCFVLTPELSLEPEPIPLEILFEDEHCLAINKPAGMVVHPAVGHPKGTFVNALLYHCRAIEGMDPLRPGIVHRIDKETSGLLLAAKTAEMHRLLVELFATRQIQKHYLAICVGTPREGLVDAPIKRHPEERKEMCIALEGGKEAKSIVKVLAKSEKLSLVEIDLLTGRTHQIRVHMKHLNAPVLGDSVYGSERANRTFGCARQLLHASWLSFIHPITGKKIELTAPPPADLQSFIELLQSQR